MTEVYQQYKSDELVQLSYKDVYEDRDGYPNLKAFDDFSEKIAKEKYRLICMNVDLRKANATNYAYGNYILRKFVLSLKRIKGCYPFRIQGEKFNLLAEESCMQELEMLLAKPNENYDLYYGILEENYNPDKREIQIQKCVEMMYLDKNRKRIRISQEKQAEKIIGDKGNTPVQDRETDTCKNRKTMWYAVIDIKAEQPYKQTQVYVFPTQYCEPMASIPLVAVSAGLTDCRYFYGKSIKYGVTSTVRLTINAHFDNDGHLKVSVFNINTGKCELNVKTVEGECIPASFGKRFGKGEIYPFRQNIAGYCDFIYLENEKAELNTSGYITDENGQRYTVHMDSQYINLMKMN